MRVATSKVLIEARPDTVWSAVTNPEHVKQWQYGSALDTDWAIGSPIRFTSEWEGEVFEQWGTVLVVDAPWELRYSLFAPRPGMEDRPENYFTMTYRLEAAGGGTVLTITQEDPREVAGEEAASDDENPVPNALKRVAESLEGTAPN